MVQVAKNRYASQQYHDFIGFQVSKPLLERAVPVVYGLEMKDVVAHEDLAIGSYRFAVSRLIPEMTQVALKTHEKDMMARTPDFAKKKFFIVFLAPLTKRSGERTIPEAWSRRPHPGRIFAIHAENRSFQGTRLQESYFADRGHVFQEHRCDRRSIPHLSARSANDSLQLPNTDLDSGKLTKSAEYSLADDTYAKLLDQLAGKKFDRMTPELRDNILDFYSDLSASIKTKKDQNDSKEVLAQLEQLKSATPVPAIAGSTTK